MKTRCGQHDGNCAYDGDESDRCPVCHCLWDVILARHDESGGSREVHQAYHVRREAARQKAIVRKAAARARQVA